MNTVIREDVVGIDGSVHYKETHLTPYIKAEFKVDRHFPIQKLTTADTMTITAELANSTVYVLAGAWLSGEAGHKVDEGTVEMEFHGQEGFYQ